MQNLLRSILAHSRNFPDKPVLHCIQSGHDTIVIYGDLYKRAAQFAAIFQASEFEKGSLAFLILKPHRENCEACFDAMMAICIPSILPFPAPKHCHDAYWDSHRKLCERVRPAPILAHDENMERRSTAISDELATQIGSVDRLGSPEGGEAVDVRDPDDEVVLRRPIDGLSARVATPAGDFTLQGDDLSPSAGEIQASGDCVFSDYYRSPEQSADAFTEDGWYKTGDIGYCLKGERHICGREKKSLIIQGENYHVGDMEPDASSVQGVKPGREVASTIFDVASDSERRIMMAETAETDPAKIREMKRLVKQEVCQAIVLAMRTVDLDSRGRAGENDIRQDEQLA